LYCALFPAERVSVRRRDLGGQPDPRLQHVSQLRGDVRPIRGDLLDQGSQTQFRPRSPAGVARVCGDFLTRNCRESYGRCAVSGFMFDHESPRPRRR
jgi:GDP-D-mannose dehydratase